MTGEVLVSEVTAADVLWAVATADQPIVSQQVAERLNVSRDRISGVLLTLHKSGLVDRQKINDGCRGPPEYRYIVSETRGETDG